MNHMALFCLQSCSIVYCSYDDFLLLMMCKMQKYTNLFFNVSASHRIPNSTLNATFPWHTHTHTHSQREWVEIFTDGGRKKLQLLANIWCGATLVSRELWRERITSDSLSGPSQHWYHGGLMLFVWLHMLSMKLLNEDVGVCQIKKQCVCVCVCTSQWPNC